MRKIELARRAELELVAERVEAIDRTIGRRVMLTAIIALWIVVIASSWLEPVPTGHTARQRKQ